MSKVTVVLKNALTDYQEEYAGLVRLNEEYKTQIDLNIKAMSELCTAITELKQLLSNQLSDEATKDIEELFNTDQVAQEESKDDTK